MVFLDLVGMACFSSVCHVKGSVNTQVASCMLDLFMNFKYFSINPGVAVDLGDISRTAE